MKQRINHRGDPRRVKLAVFFFALLWPPLVCTGAHSQDASASQKQQAHHTFTPGYLAKAIPMSGALRASVHTFKAEDGTPVYQSDDWYKSADDANNALNKLTKRASHVVAQSAKKDAKGHIIGGRVELVFSHGHDGSPEMTIAWTNGAAIVRLRSTSLPLLLDFESQYYP